MFTVHGNKIPSLTPGVRVLTWSTNNIIWCWPEDPSDRVLVRESTAQCTQLNHVYWKVSACLSTLFAFVCFSFLPSWMSILLFLANTRKLPCNVNKNNHQHDNLLFSTVKSYHNDRIVSSEKLSLKTAALVSSAPTSLPKPVSLIKTHGQYTFLSCILSLMTILLALCLPNFFFFSVLTIEE